MWCSGLTRRPHSDLALWSGAFPTPPDSGPHSRPRRAQDFGHLLEDGMMKGSLAGRDLLMPLRVIHQFGYGAEHPLGSSLDPCDDALIVEHDFALPVAIAVAYSAPQHAALGTTVGTTACTPMSHLCLCSLAAIDSGCTFIANRSRTGSSAPLKNCDDVCSHHRSRSHPTHSTVRRIPVRGTHIFSRACPSTPQRATAG